MVFKKRIAIGASAIVAFFVLGALLMGAFYGYKLTDGVRMYGFDGAMASLGVMFFTMLFVSVLMLGVTKLTAWVLNGQKKDEDDAKAAKSKLQQADATSKA